MISTVSITMKSFIMETAKYLKEKCGYEVTLICSDDPVFAAQIPEGIRYIPVNMSRGIDISALKAIKDFIGIFSKEKFDMVQYSTPNASCYASIAAWICRVPIRMYCQWGIRYVGMTGCARKLFKQIEKMICCLSTHIRSVSLMNMQFAIDEGLYNRKKAKVVGNGGTIGVDMNYFAIEEKEKWNNELRKKMEIDESSFVFGYAGRVSGDKGCGELLAAFRELTKANQQAKLMIVGPLEDKSGVEEELLEWAKKSKQVLFTGLVENADMRKYYAMMDVLVHPTYREGFGMVIQEAGALAIPVITTKIPGASEVMEDGTSCLLVEARNMPQLYDAMNRMLNDRDEVRRLGKNAYERTKRLYERHIMLENQRQNYVELLK